MTNSQTLRLEAAIADRRMRVGTRITLGLGMLLIYLNSHAGVRGLGWEVLGWAGAGMIVLSFPSQVYDIYFRYKRNKLPRKTFNG